MKKIMALNDRAFFLYVLIAAAIVQLLFAIFSVGFHHFDEHFQVVEFMNLKLGGTSANELPWEFHYRMRSYLQPFILYLVTKPLLFFRIESTTFLTFLYRLISGALGFYSFVLIWKSSKYWIKDLLSHRMALILLFFTWFVPYIHTRHSSENWGMSFLLMGIACTVLWSQNFTEKKFPLVKALLIGLMLGMAFILRFQLGVAVFFLFLWCLVFRKIDFFRITLISLGVLLVVALNSFVDYWGYADWTFSWVNYFKQNIVENKVSNFGVSPWWDYLRLCFNRGIPPVSLFFMITTLLFWIKWPKHLLTWTTVPLFILHCIIGHKELRFIFPIILCAPLMSAFFISSIEKNKVLKGLFIFIFSINGILLVGSTFKAANVATTFYNYLESNEYIRAEEIYFYSGDPFKMVGKELKFFSHLRPKENYIDSLDSIQKGNEFIIFSDSGEKYFEIESKYNKCETLYSSYPKWSFKFNVGNWLSRSRVWVLQRCQG